MCIKPIFALLLSLICILNAGAHAGSVGIAHYDVEMKVLAERNTVQMRTRCTIRNDGPAELTQLAFDLLAREGRCKASAEVRRIWQKVSGDAIFLKFKHGQNGQDSSGKKLIYVTLASGLAPGSSTEIAFDYTWQATDPTNTRDNYRPFATLPDGGREICLLSDIKWLPVVQTAQEGGGTNRFARARGPTCQDGSSGRPASVRMEIHGPLLPAIDGGAISEANHPGRVDKGRPLPSGGLRSGSRGKNRPRAGKNLRFLHGHIRSTGR
ncbi:MAG: hypothetical protein ACYTBS_03830 [Planctomycetota bacterium]